MELDHRLVDQEEAARNLAVDQMEGVRHSSAVQEGGHHNPEELPIQSILLGPDHPGSVDLLLGSPVTNLKV